MKMKPTNLLFMAAVGVLAVSCSKDSPADDTSGTGTATSAQVYSVKIVTPNAHVDTRISWDEENQEIHWHKTDSIGMFYVANNENKLTYMTLQGDTENATVGNFVSQPITGTPKGLIYPYNSKHSLSNDGILSIYFPSKYTYTTVGENDNSLNIPYYGQWSIGGQVSLTAEPVAIGAVLAIKVPYMPTNKGVVTVTAVDNKFSGAMTTTVTDSIKALTMQKAENTKEKKVQIAYSNATEGEPGWFYVPVPTGTCKFTVKVASYGTVETKKSYFFESDTLSESVTADEIQQVVLEKANSKSAFTERDIYVSSTSSDVYFLKGDKDEEWHEMVDLDIAAENGKALLFAKLNIGATKETEFGYYFKGGGIEELVYEYGNDNMELRAYYPADSCYANNILKTAHDAATQKWGSSFRTPTITDLKKLASKVNGDCGKAEGGYTWGWTSEKYSYNGYRVYRDESAKESCNKDVSIFLPTGSVYTNAYESRGREGYIWSSTLNERNSRRAFVLYFNERYCTADALSYRDRCIPVRPVAEL